MIIKLDDLLMGSLNEELDNFEKTDSSIRKELEKGMSIFELNDFGKDAHILQNKDLSNAYISVNNNVKLFINFCKKHDILVPINYLMARDLCYYLENIYYTDMMEPYDAIYNQVHEFASKGKIYRLIHSAKYYDKISGTLLNAISEYNRVTDKINSFDINQNGEEVLDYVVKHNNYNDEELHRVIACHKHYHKKVGNEKVLEMIKQKI